MWLERLTPGVQNTQEADERTEALWVRGCFEQRSGGGLEQESEQHSLVLPHEWNQPVWRAEDHVIVSDR